MQVDLETRSYAGWFHIGAVFLASALNPARPVKHRGKIDIAAAPPLVRRPSNESSSFVGVLFPGWNPAGGYVVHIPGRVRSCHGDHVGSSISSECSERPGVDARVRTHTSPHRPLLINRPYKDPRRFPIGKLAQNSIPGWSDPGSSAKLLQTHRYPADMYLWW